MKNLLLVSEYIELCEELTNLLLNSISDKSNIFRAIENSYFDCSEEIFKKYFDMIYIEKPTTKSDSSPSIVKLSPTPIVR